MTDSARVDIARVGQARVGSIGVITDSGTGHDDARDINVHLQTSDSAHAADAPSSEAVLTLFDVGHFADQVAVEIIGASIVVRDTGMGVDSVQRDYVHVTVRDEGLGSDRVRDVSVDVVATDSGAGDDSPQQASRFKLSDSGQGEEALSITATISAVDSGQGIDSASAELVAKEIIVMDSAVGTTRVGALSVHFTSSDDGIGEESITQSRKFTVTDWGGLADHTSRVGLARVGRARVGHLGGGETVTVKVQTPPIPDFGQGIDSVHTVRMLTVTDAGTGFDEVAVVVGFTVSDQGEGTESALDVVELVRPPFRVIIANPRVAPRLNDPKTKAVLWP